MMNHFREPLAQRFEDLMYDSGLTAQGCWDEIDDYGREAIEKLAVLIVKDCAKLIEDVSSKDLGMYLRFAYGVKDE